MSSVSTQDTGTQVAPIQEDSVPQVASSTRREGILDAIALVAALAIFLSLTLYQLDLPGLYPDEAFDVVPTMQIVLGHPVELQRNAGIHLFGLDLPLMSSSDYQGVTSTYLALPFFAIGGISVYSLRLMTVLVGALAILLTFLLAGRWFGRGPARIAALLLAVSPAWVFWSRLGVYVVSEVVPIAAGALLAFTIWARRRPIGQRNGPLYTGMFLLGLGLATKLLFVWLITALVGCAVLLYGRQLWERRREWLADWLRWLQISLAAVGAFCIGAFPFLLYNAMTRGTLYVLRANAGSTTHGVNNSAVVRNLWTEADAFRVLLDGSYFWFQGKLGQVYFNPLTPAVFALSAIGLVALVIAARTQALGSVTSLMRVPAVMVVASMVLAARLAFTGSEGTASKLLLVGSIGLGVVGVAWLAIGALRSDSALPFTGWLLLLSAALYGAIWWFGGSGRPEGPAPGMPLGLWPIDAAGVLFWMSGAALLLVLGFDRQPSPFQRVTVAALAIIGLVVAQSAVTLSGLWATHLLLVLPLPQMVIAAFIVLASRWLWAHIPAVRTLPSGARVVPATLALVALIGLDLVVAYSYHRDLAATGGGSTFSDAIYSLADYLDSQAPQQKVVALDWGFKRPLQLLTKERVNPIEAYGYTPEATPEFRSTLKELFQNPSTLYLFHTPQGTAYPRFDAFSMEVGVEGKHPTLVKKFYHRDGVPVYEVWEVR